MAHDHPRITFKLEGPDGLVQLDDFAASLKALSSCVTAVSECIVGEAIPYEVCELRIGSGLATICPPKQSQIVLGQQIEVKRVFDATCQALNTNAPIDARLDYPAISSFKALSRLVRKPGRILSVDDNILVPTFSHSLRRHLSATKSSWGTVSGRLEGLTIHATNQFKLYTSIHNEAVVCQFAKDQLDSVLKAVDKSVTAYGELFYARGKVFPHTVKVSSFEIDEIDEHAGSLTDCRGKLRSRLTSQKMVRKMRDEWNW